MKFFILLASLTTFFTLQAIYWIWTNRQRNKDARLVDRLGVDERLAEGDTLMREEADGGALSQSLNQLLLDAGEDANIGAFMSRMAIWFFVTFTLVLVVTQSIFGAVMLGLLSLALPLLGVLRKKRKRLERIEEQLPEALEVMTISLRAGHSLDQTIRVTAAELEAPIGDEFRRVAEECELGRPLDEALVQMAERLDVRTIRTFVVSVLVLRQTGGNLIEVLDSIIDTMRQQTQYERKLRAMTAEGRSSSRMLAGLPPTFVTVVWLAQPTYVGKMVTSGMGQTLLAMALTLYFLGLFWVRRLTSPKRA